MDAPIIGYRIFFVDANPEDYPDLDSAWERRTRYMEETKNFAYVHTLRLGGPEYPVFE